MPYKGSYSGEYKGVYKVLASFHDSGKIKVRIVSTTTYLVDGSGHSFSIVSDHEPGFDYPGAKEMAQGVVLQLIREGHSCHDIETNFDDRRAA